MMKETESGDKRQTSITLTKLVFLIFFLFFFFNSTVPHSWLFHCSHEVFMAGIQSKKRSYNVLCFAFYLGNNDIGKGLIK